MADPYKLSQSGANIPVGCRTYDSGSEHVECEQVLFVNEAV